MSPPVWLEHVSSPIVVAGDGDAAGGGVDGSGESAGTLGDGVGVDGGTEDAAGDPTAAPQQAARMRTSAGPNATRAGRVFVFMRRLTRRSSVLLRRWPCRRADSGRQAVAASGWVSASEFGARTTISGRPVTTSHAGSTMTTSSGRIVASPIISAAMKIASQPLRVTATRIPTRLAPRAIASGTAGNTA